MDGAGAVSLLCRCTRRHRLRVEGGLQPNTTTSTARTRGSEQCRPASPCLRCHLHKAQQHIAASRREAYSGAPAARRVEKARARAAWRPWPRPCATPRSSGGARVCPQRATSRGSAGCRRTRPRGRCRSASAAATAAPAARSPGHRTPRRTRSGARPRGPYGHWRRQTWCERPAAC